nr:hypothetical protein [Tanacetum cinerariifolium]
MRCDEEIDDLLRIRLHEVGSDEQIFTSVVLGLYQATELDEEGFNVYFEGVLLLRGIHKMITYGLCQRTTRYDKIQENVMWLLSMFHARHQNGYANVAWLIARSSSALVYCRNLNTITLRKLIDSESRLIPEDPLPGVPRVGIPIPSRVSMQDLYNRMGKIEIRIEIRQEAIEQMEYRQSYQWD